MDLVSVEHDFLERLSHEVLAVVERHTLESLANGQGELGERTKYAPSSAVHAVLPLEGVEIRREVGNPLGYYPSSFLERLLLEEPALVGVPQALSLGSNS